MGEPTIDGDEEVDFIVDKCKDYECTKEDIIQILDSYYEKAHEDGNPENHYKRIAEETNLSLELILLVFHHQLEFLREKGIVT